MIVVSLILLFNYCYPIISFLTRCNCMKVAFYFILFPWVTHVLLALRFHILSSSIIMSWSLCLISCSTNFSRSVRLLCSFLLSNHKRTSLQVLFWVVKFSTLRCFHSLISLCGRTSLMWRSCGVISWGWADHEWVIRFLNSGSLS
jgi:hypothetical protein